MARRPELWLLSTKDHHPRGRDSVQGSGKICRDGFAVGGEFRAHCWHVLLAAPLGVGSISSDFQR